MRRLLAKPLIPTLLLVAACSSSQGRSESGFWSFLGQAATGDADLTLRATTLTPAPDGTLTLQADAPTIIDTTTITHTLEGQWDRTRLNLAAVPVSPQGWSIDYYSNGAKLSPAPASSRMRLILVMWTRRLLPLSNSGVTAPCIVDVLTIPGNASMRCSSTSSCFLVSRKDTSRNVTTPDV
jgi:hypothetical protein